MHPVAVIIIVVNLLWFVVWIAGKISKHQNSSQVYRAKSPGNKYQPLQSVGVDTVNTRSAPTTKDISITPASTKVNPIRLINASTSKLDDILYFVDKNTDEMFYCRCEGKVEFGGKVYVLGENLIRITSQSVELDDYVLNIKYEPEFDRLTYQSTGAREVMSWDPVGDEIAETLYRNDEKVVEGVTGKLKKYTPGMTF